jgi:hypothetical protein
VCFIPNLLFIFVEKITLKRLITLCTLILIASSCAKDTPVTIDPKTPVVGFSNVVILGNSITRASPDASVGWNNNWGMAATRAELDYVHLLTAKLKTLNPDVEVNTKPTGEFEIAYKTFDYITYYADMKALHPDLLIMRFGENIVQDNPDLIYFDARYAGLVAYFRDGNPNLKILAVGSFWGNPVVDESMKKYSKFVTLTPLLNDSRNQAFGQFENYGVSIHPSDMGMQKICDIIWSGLADL